MTLEIDNNLMDEDNVIKYRKELFGIAFCNLKLSQLILGLEQA